MRVKILSILLPFLLLGAAAPVAAQDDEESSEEGGLDSPSGEGGDEEATDEPETVEEAAEESIEEPALEDPPGPSSAILADLSLGVIGVGFEFLVEQAIAIHASAQFYAPWYQNDGGTYGVGGEVRFFWFFAADGYEGAYLSPGFRAAYVFHPEDDETRDGYMLGGRMSLGYGWIFDNFYLRVGAGGQYETVNLSEIEGQTSEDFGTPYLVLDLYLGWVG